MRWGHLVILLTYQLERRLPDSMVIGIEWISYKRLAQPFPCLFLASQEHGSVYQIAILCV